jgi:hypothetical protein
MAIRGRAMAERAGTTGMPWGATERAAEIQFEAWIFFIATLTNNRCIPIGTHPVLFLG